MMPDIERSEKSSEPSPEEINEAVQNLKGWISKEPHLPQIDDEEWLKTFFFNNKFSLEKTKSKLDAYYSLRSKYPRILKNWDPNAPEMAPFRDNIHISPKLTADGDRVAVIRHDPDPDKFVMEDHVKYIMMCLDLSLLEKERLASYIWVLDCRNFQYTHFLKVVLGMKPASEILIEAYTERIESINLVNVPSFIGLAMKTIMPFYPEKLTSRVRVHNPFDNSLIELIGEDALYTDLGGKGPSYAECAEWTFKKLEQRRKWFEDQDNVCSDEQLRKKENGHQLDEMRGSFRKLEVD